MSSSIKTIKSNAKLQRRMDSLSRLLSVDLNITPCIALAFIEDNFLITLNTPKNLNEFPIDHVQKLIEDKLILLRKFLLEFEPHKARKMAIDYTYLLRKLGGTGVLSSKNYSGDGKKYTVGERIQTDLLKLAEFYRNSPSANEEEGFSQKHRDALMKAQPYIVYPNSEKEGVRQAKVHAEQLIVLKAEQYYQARNILNFKVTIGISKLACQTCESVLSQETDRFSYRGVSGVNFPNVINIKTDQKSSSVFTPSSRENLFPDESDSETEFATISHFRETYLPHSFFRSLENEEPKPENRSTPTNQSCILVK